VAKLSKTVVATADADMTMLPQGESYVFSRVSAVPTDPTKVKKEKSYHDEEQLLCGINYRRNDGTVNGVLHLTAQAALEGLLDGFSRGVYEPFTALKGHFITNLKESEISSHVIK
jgi:hypothetical protein